MAENIQRNRGRGQGYKFDRGGTPSEFGPYIGIVKNNVDSLRSGRLQVYIEEFGGTNEEDSSLWRTVAYVPPFYGVVQQSGTTKGTGSYVGNPQSYGMWFTPPDLDTRVICFFAAGDPNQGYYTGCIPELGINHMIPAVGSSTQFTTDNSDQNPYFANATQLPVTELNSGNQAINDNPKFYDAPKPVHSYTAAVMLQQGLVNDTIRGPISSNSQRESPSTVYGVSTPGRPITQGNVNEDNFAQRVNSTDLKDEDIKVIGRRGGHSIVLDDGNNEGYDNLVRIRTGKGHQILMSDDGDCFHIIHANGQTWLEFGSEGTVDVFATNSVNVRTQGEINLHADSRINMYAGEEINIKSKTVKINATKAMDIASSQSLAVYGKTGVGISSDSVLSLSSKVGGWESLGSLSFNSIRLDLNSGISVPNLIKPSLLPDFALPDVKFVAGQGWQQQPNKLTSIVTRAPTHEPYPYHNRGVEVQVELDEGTVPPAGATAAAPPAAAPAPTAVEQTAAGLANLPVPAPVSSAQVIKEDPAVDRIGNLSTRQVTSLKASAAALTGRTVQTVTGIAGIGKYGITPTQLQKLGVIKPGTIERFGSARAVVDIIDNPSIWTGKYGITEAAELVGNEVLQGALQETAMAVGFRDLTEVGLITGAEPAEIAGGLVLSATQFTPAQLSDWATGIADIDVKSAIDSVSKNAYQAVELTTDIAIDTATEFADDLAAGAQGLVGDVYAGVAGIVDDFTGSITQISDSIGGFLDNAASIDFANTPIDQIPNALQLGDLSAAANIISAGLSSIGLGFGSGASTLPVNLFGSVNTVQRQRIGDTVIRVIGNNKVVPPSYTPRKRTPDGSTQTIDVRQIQRAARSQAIREVLDRGGSIQEAEAAGQVAGNLAGRDALRNARP